MTDSDALCLIVMDDFFSTVKKIGGNVLSRAKDLYQLNKPMIDEMIASVID